MKITIDTTLKTIELKEDIKFNSLIDELNRLFNSNSWKEYTIKVFENSFTTTFSFPYTTPVKPYTPFFDDPFKTTC